MPDILAAPLISARKTMIRRKHYRAIACDADGTLTWRQRLSLRTAGALVRWREAGGKVILVTGEVRDDLLHLARTGLFDRIVGENGGTLLRPPAWRAQALSEGAAAELARLLRPRVHPLLVGQVLVGTQRPHNPSCDPPSVPSVQSIA